MHAEDTELATLAGTVLSRESDAVAALADRVEARCRRRGPPHARDHRQGRHHRLGDLRHHGRTAGSPAVRMRHSRGLPALDGRAARRDGRRDRKRSGARHFQDRAVPGADPAGANAWPAAASTVVAMTESPESPFARAAAMVVALPPTAADADPGDMIAMASTLAVGAWGDALAVVAMAMRGHTVRDVVDSHPAGGVGARGQRPGDESAPVVRHERQSAVLGVDSSTQSCKVEVRELATGRLLGSRASAPHPPAFPPSSEQEPEPVDRGVRRRRLALRWPAAIEPPPIRAHIGGRPVPRPGAARRARQPLAGRQTLERHHRGAEPGRLVGRIGASVDQQDRFHADRRIHHRQTRLDGRTRTGGAQPHRVDPVAA